MGIRYFIQCLLLGTGTLPNYRYRIVEIKGTTVPLRYPILLLFYLLTTVCFKKIFAA